MTVLCDRCKKRVAVVFVSTDASSKPQGLCAVCAKELGITQVTDIMEKMGITDEMLEEASEQLTGLMAEGGENGLLSLFGGEAGENEDFEMGGAPTMPQSLQELFGQTTGVQDKKEKNFKENKKNPPNKKRKYIDAYTENLTRKARNGKLDRIIGRDAEIARTVQILSRRTKNNPCFIGEPGVGKTAIAEGLALRIAAGEVPLRLQNKEICLLDLTALVAGTQFRGQFESRIKGLIEEVRAEGNIILFIDEVHNLVSAGDSEGSMNAANILKPALSRGEIQVIGATTFTEYRKYIEKDAALERRFQPVKVLEPSIEDTVKVLIGIKEYYENYHRVTVSDQLIKEAVVLSERYVTDRFLPDKAIDLLDEACTCAALRNLKMREYDSVMMELAKKEQEEEATANADPIDYEQVATLRAEIARLNQQADQLRPESIGAPVTQEDLARVLTLWTGIPSEKIQSGELQRLGALEEVLKKRVIGQNEAVEKLSAAVRRSRAQISPRRRPASFIFVGPTGVGKTELCKALSEELFDTPETLIRLDMSEFMEKHSVSRIIGSPPGYVGYDEAGQVTEKVRRQPYSVLLLDEIEKAHPDVMNILLQILDEGRITDAQGRTVNFENTILVMTSNAGSERKEALLGFGKTEDAVQQEKALKALGEFLRPEFLSRVDEVIVFRPLTQQDYEGIADLMLGEYVPVLKEKGITFLYDGAASAWIAQCAFNGKNGARDIRNTIRREVEDRIANTLIEQGAAISGVSLTVSQENDSLVLLTL